MFASQFAYKVPLIIACSISLLCISFSIYAAPLDSKALQQQYIENGVALDIKISPATGDKIEGGSDATVNVRVSDAATGAPISGARPLAWMTARLSEMVSNETECGDKVRTLIGGKLGARADVDLNGYTLFTLNSDNSVTVINPMTGFNLTKLESIIQLPGKGVDWVLSPDKNFIYVSMPDKNAVAVIDANKRKLLHVIAMGEGTKPQRMLQSADGAKVWVALDGAGSVAVIDTATKQVAAKIITGAGLHHLALSDDGAYAYVANSTDDTMSVIDARKLSKISDIKVGKTPIALAYSALAKSVYVAALNDENIIQIDAENFNINNKLKIKRGVVSLRIESTGRYLVALNQLQNKLSVFDTATNREMAQVKTIEQPDQIAFTQRYIYVRGLASERFTLVDWNDVKKGSASPADIQAGRQAPSAQASDIGMSAMMVPAPEGNTMMIANGPDKTIYFYQEGMMAPSGTFSNYKRTPLALMLVDRSLNEIAPGTYQTHIKLPAGGRYDVPVVLNQPRMLHCFSATVEANPAAKKQIAHKTATTIKPVFDTGKLVAGQSNTFSVRVTDTASGLPVMDLSDLTILLFEPPGSWQQRGLMRHVGDGVYHANYILPTAGTYELMFASNQRGFNFQDLPRVTLQVTAAGMKTAESKP
jgi:YVTN family beta-propeller protein